MDSFNKLPILGIIRGISARDLEPVMESALSAGLKTVEITMNTPHAASLISGAVKRYRDRLAIGAGTVLDTKALKGALSAGAEFIVTPALTGGVTEYCAKRKIPVFAGALTPHEVITAWNAGATMVKVFPSGFFGPAYFRELKGPFDRVKLLACGGVRPDNMKDYFAGGADAVSFGAGVFRMDWLAAKDYKKIEQSIRAFIKSYNEIRNTNGSRRQNEMPLLRSQ